MVRPKLDTNVLRDKHIRLSYNERRVLVDALAKYKPPTQARAKTRFDLKNRIEAMK